MAIDVGSDEIAVTVHNVAPTVVLTGADEVDEGDVETYSYTVEDPGVNDTFTVDADFPDCDAGGANGVLVGTPVQTASGGSFVCRFPDGDKTANVKIKVTDNDGGSTTDSEDVVIVEIANVAPVVTAAAEPVVGRGRVQELRPGLVHRPRRRRRLDRVGRLGDGSTEYYATGTKGPLGGRLHTFGDGDATYTVIVTVTDKDGASDSATFDVVVSNVAPTVVLSGADAAAEGDVVHYTYSIFDPGNDTVQSVDPSCGDGGDLVPGSASNTNLDGEFDCLFADGPAVSGGVGLGDRFRRRDGQHVLDRGPRVQRGARRHGGG